MECIPNEYDQDGIMRAVGPVLPVILRESVDHGFFDFAKSRRLDPKAHADYTDSTLAGMLIDRITAVARGLLIIAQEDDDRLHWKISANKRATEIYLDPLLAFRIKRGKQNRSGRTTSYGTWRQRKIKSIPDRLIGRQWVLPYLGRYPIELEDEDRVWLTVPFDTDELEESLATVFIGVELSTRYLWKEALHEADPDVIASLPAQLADRVSELRALRSA